jgi:hypothetical protein
LERVRVKDVSTGVTIEFDHGDWLTSEKKEVLLPCCKGKPTFPYDITVVTGKDHGSGTDSKVFCALHGESWSCSGELALASSMDNPDPFETGKSDTFRHLFPRSLGRITSLTVRFDATGFGADWLLDRVSVKDVTSGQVFEFQHGDWLTQEKKEVLLEALPQPPVVEPCDAAAVSKLRLPPTLSLPGCVPDSSERRELGLSAEAPATVDAFTAVENLAVAGAASERKERLKRAANMLLRLGISRKSSEPRQDAPI